MLNLLYLKESRSCCFLHLGTLKNKCYQIKFVGFLKVAAQCTMVMESTPYFFLSQLSNENISHIYAMVSSLITCSED